MRRVADAAITVLCLAFLIPALVVTSAWLGLKPRHWSGVPLAAVVLPPLVSSVERDGDRSPLQDDVVDGLVAVPYGGWLSVGSGTGGQVYVETTRISPSLFPSLGKRFHDDTVGVVYSPRAVKFHAASDRQSPYWQSWWQRTDPVGSWFTLLYGFPRQIGFGLALAGGTWAIILRRRKAKLRSQGA